MNSMDIEKSKTNGYSNELFTYLNNLVPGTEVSVDRICDYTHREYFISVVKWYIKSHGDVEFNSDYTKIKKLERLAFEEDND